MVRRTILYYNSRFDHNVYLSEESGLELLEKISDFNLEASYLDDKFSFYKKSAMEFTKNKIEQIERLKKWLLQKLRSPI
ncbi:MAG: hypothetical protein B6I30_06300 [Desulfobacteraceae bacterium 4572_187]|nr:MAG: hypothetical protein B6I30_06300 [Desulfobacteraceae bacterium 4572_187]